MKNAGFWTGIVILGFAGVIFWQSLLLDYYTGLGPGPGLLPLWLSGGLIILALIYIWECVSKEVVIFADVLPKGKGLRNLLFYSGSLLIFMLIVNFTGFIIAGTVLLFIVLAREYKWYLGLGISVGVSVVLFVIFQTLLGIPLPVNAFGW
ncbi:tripartite tricarboxylate transporter TctB family protein [Ammoniphilus sp. 3BR4]|uniref:tripartite tricarboxylate transporter TctB family protein n=1 Tax=Ammoniphilus sp. 3BR4 TaxID=3158265 RepID=UPI0034675AC1